MHKIVIVSGQQCRNKIYQALIHTQYLLVDQFIVGLDPNMRFVDKKKNIGNRQTSYKKHLLVNFIKFKQKTAHKTMHDIQKEIVSGCC